MVDGGGEILLAEVVAADVEVRPFVARIGGDELVEVTLLFGRVAVAAGLGGENEQSFAVGCLRRKRHGLAQMVEEILGARRGVRAAQFRQREVRVERDRLVEVRDRVLRLQLLGQLTPLEERLPGSVGAGRYGDLAAVRRGGGDRGQTEGNRHRDHAKRQSSRRHRVSPCCAGSKRRRRV